MKTSTRIMAHKKEIKDAKKKSSNAFKIGLNSKGNRADCLRAIQLYFCIIFEAFFS